MSSCPPSATWPSTSSVAGLMLSNRAPDAASTSSPSMSRRLSGSNDPTLVSIIAASSLSVSAEAFFRWTTFRAADVA